MVSMVKPEVHGEVARQVRQVVEPTVSAAGLYLESVRIVGSGGSQSVRITVDLPETAVGSLGSDELGDVSRAISAALDREDVVPGSYTLEVSTPGATRTLHEARQFRRARTRLVHLVLANGPDLTGRLTRVDGTDDDATLILEIAGKEKKVPLAEVKSEKVELEMSRLDDPDEDEA